MSDTSIEWTDKTWNPLDGCTPVSAGCQNCYAAGVALRFPKTYPGLAEMRGGPGQRRAVFTGKILLHEERLKRPLTWRTPCRVFVNSMSDLFHEDVPFEFVDKVFAVMALCQQHTFQVLTKRPERMAEYVNGKDRVGRLTKAEDTFILTWPLPNVWLGTSVEDQAAADLRIPRLLGCAAAVRFLSCEPLIGPVDLTKMWALPFERNGSSCLGGHPLERRIQWIIAGGESGRGARPCNVQWIRAIVAQCRAAYVPVFVKQLGACVEDRNDAGFEGDHGEWPMDTHTRDIDSGYQGAPVRVLIKDAKGGEPGEWPEDLRVREFPREVRA